ncbi:MAG: replicative DNA helicase [Myxococcota bacterium]
MSSQGLPHNLETERSLLGGLLLDASQLGDVREKLKPDDFHRPWHQTLFRVMGEMSDAGITPDPTTVLDELERKNLTESCGGAAYVLGLPGACPSVENVEKYAELVKKHALRRNLHLAAQSIIEEVQRGEKDTDALLSESERLIFEIAQLSGPRDWHPLSVVVDEQMMAIQERSRRPGDVTGVPTGFVDLDRMLAGLQRTDLIVLAARPAMGKTAMVLNLALNGALRGHVAVGIFSLEMSRQQLVQRMLCSQARVDASKVRTGHLDPHEDWRQLVEAAEQLHALPILIDDTPGLTITQLRSKARRLKSEHPDLGLIIIDYLQLMQGTGGAKESRENVISTISRGLKILAKELEVPVIALSQLNRSLESRTDKRPLPSDLRECVTGDTKVVLADGRRMEIRELEGRTPEVVTVRADGRLDVARSEAVWRVGTRPVFRVRLASGREVRATAEHRLFGARGWVHVRDLRPDDRLAISRRLPAPVEPASWPDDHLVLLGHLVGDGSYLVHQPLRYTTASEENSDAVRQAASRGFGVTVTRHRGRGAWHQLVLSGNGNRWHPAGVNRWLRELGLFGQRSHEKRLPGGVFTLPDRQVALLLRHLWATDGCIHVRPVGARGSPRVFFSTNSRGLADDVAALLLRVGIVARIREIRQGRHRDLYAVDVTGGEAQLRFLDVVGAFGPRVAPAAALRSALARTTRETNVDTLPREWFDDVRAAMAERGVRHRNMAARRGTSHGGSAHFKFAPSRATFADYARILGDDLLLARSESDLFWDRVVSVEPAGEEEVWDLTVPGTATWLADGVVSHNSGAIEQDADVILFIYRDEVYNPDSPDKGIAEIIVAKQRSGPIGTVKLAFIGKYVLFQNLAAAQDAPDGYF